MDDDSSGNPVSQQMPVLDDDPTNDVDEMIVEPDDSAKSDTDMMEGGEMMKNVEDAGGNGMMDKSMMPRIIAITADNFLFAPSAITVKKGEDVTLKITGAAGTHGFAIPDLGINVSVAPGQTVSVKLPTDTVGTFGFMCSIPCGAGHRDMKGTVTVE